PPAEIYTLSLHDALPILSLLAKRFTDRGCADVYMRVALYSAVLGILGAVATPLAPNPGLALVLLVPTTVGSLAATSAGLAGLMRSEEHTSELQSPCNLVC